MMLAVPEHVAFTDSLDLEPGFLKRVHGTNVIGRGNRADPLIAHLIQSILDHAFGGLRADPLTPPFFVTDEKTELRRFVRRTFAIKLSCPDGKPLAVLIHLDHE